MFVQIPPSRPIVRQLRFLMRVAELIPTLMAALESGHVESGQRLGRRTLKDGREMELWLVAKAPERDTRPLVADRVSEPARRSWPRR